MFGEKIRELRGKYGYTQERLAELVGVSHVSISQWENGKAYPRMGMVIKLASVFKVDPAELVGTIETSLSYDEAQLLKAYRALNAKGKARLLEDAKTMLASGLYAPAKNNQDIA